MPELKNMLVVDIVELTKILIDTLLTHLYLEVITLNAQRRLKYSMFSAQYIGDVIGSVVMTKVTDTHIRSS
jgi:hypothetical protein